MVWAALGLVNPAHTDFTRAYLLTFVIVASCAPASRCIGIGRFPINPPQLEGIDTKHSRHIPFHPYYTIKDMLEWRPLLGLSCSYSTSRVLCINPDNAIPANPGLLTPADSVPEWYLVPFYAILKIDLRNKLLVYPQGPGAIWAVRSAWLDTSPDTVGRLRRSTGSLLVLVADCLLSF